MENNNQTKSMEKFLAVENKINSIFNVLMDRTLSDGDRMTHFVETKPYLEKLKATLIQVTETGDSVLKGKAESLLAKIEEASKDFGAKYLGVKVDTKSTEEVPTATVNDINTCNPKEDKSEVSTYFVVVGGDVVEKYEVTKKELLDILNEFFYDKNPTVIEGSILNLKVETKTVYTL